MSLLRICFFLLIILGAVPISYGDNPGLRVELTVQSDLVPNFGKFEVGAKIINTGIVTQSLRVWSCASDDSWMVDNPSVILDAWTCKNNSLDEIALKPGEAYENKEFPLVLSVSIPAKEVVQESVTFRLGFKRDVLNAGDIDQPPVWSDPVTIQITQP